MGDYLRLDRRFKGCAEGMERDKRGRDFILHVLWILGSSPSCPRSPFICCGGQEPWDLCQLILRAVLVVRPLFSPYTFSIFPPTLFFYLFIFYFLYFPSHQFSSGLSDLAQVSSILPPLLRVCLHVCDRKGRAAVRTVWLWYRHCPCSGAAEVGHEGASKGNTDSLGREQGRKEAAISPTSKFYRRLVPLSSLILILWWISPRKWDG